MPVLARAKKNVSDQTKSVFKDVEFEVFKAVTVKSGVFWDVTPCGSCKKRHFVGT
jgi:hypothetical protein